MADSVTIFQHITETEKLLALLKNRNEPSWLNFLWEDKKSSLLYSQAFEEFTKQLWQSINEFEHSAATTNLTTIQLELLGIPKEQISKETFRQFFNELVLKFNRDGLDNHYSYFATDKFPFFILSNESEISERDKSSATFWKDQVVRDFEKISKESPQEEPKEQTKVTQEKEADGSVVTTVIDDGMEISRTRVKKGERAQIDQGDGTFIEVNNQSEALTSNTATPLSPFEIQKLAAQEGWRNSSVLLDDILNSAFEVDDWHALYNSLSGEQQQKLDFQIYSIQEDLASVISLYLQERPDFAVLLNSSQTLSVTDRLNIRSALQAQVGEVYKRLTSHEYFMLKTEVLKEGLGLKTAFNESHFKGPQQTAQDATKLFMDKQQEEDTGPKNYSILQQQEFKRQLKQIAVFNTLVSEQSMESIGKRILAMNPGAEGIDMTEFNLLFEGEPGFSLGIEERQQLLKEVNKYLKELHTTGLSQADLENFKKFKNFERNNPKEALASLLKAYGVDGVSEKNLRNTLDAYILSLGSPHQLDQNLRGLLDQIDPRLRNDNDVLRILQSYVAERKYVLADYTGNQLLTYSLEDTETPLGFNTDQYRGMILVYSQRYEGDSDQILAQAFFNRGLENAEAANEQQRYYMDEAKKVRVEYLKELERGLQTASEAERDYYGQLFGINRQQFLTSGATELSASGQAQYNAALFDAISQYQPWNAPQVGGGTGMVQGLSNLREWLGRAKTLGKLNAQSLGGVATKVASSSVRKGVVVAGAGAGAGLAVYGIISNLVQGVVGSTLGGVAGGAVFGGAIGSIIPGVGTLIGAGVGGVGGGILGFIRGITMNGAAGGGGGSTAGLTAARSLLQNAGQTAFNTASSGATSISSAAANTLTAASANISVSTTAVAVGAPLAGVTIFTIITTQMLFNAFLPDASTTQVAPYFSLDVEESRYVTLRKTADPSNAATPGTISYSITLTKKDDATEDIIITGFTDTPSAIDKDSNKIDPPSIPQEVLDQLKSYEGKPLTEPIQIDFQVDASDPRFQDSLIKNDINVKFTANGTTDESTNRAQTCFGDCPQTVLPACWPTLGTVWQPPCATGTRANPIYNANATYSHHDASRNVCLDAYDVGAGIGQPVFAMGPGSVIFAEMDPRTVASPGSGYGNLIKIDHGGFVTFYAHQNDFQVHAGDTVEGGQLIGHVGMNGFSSGPHLHFEVVGLQEFMFQDLFGISGKSVPTNGPRCDEYYGNAQ